jgi:hypothetical protein
MKLVAMRFDSKKGKNPSSEDIIISGSEEKLDLDRRLWKKMPTAAHTKHQCIQ